ncbi:MAG: hypothetical protein M3M96_01030, partial [Candidatus Eremiobacteraeota bacterium]|nr:hypothetical protein [Candidatus Eremiobacteraeota bacterium]
MLRVASVAFLAVFLASQLAGRCAANGLSSGHWIGQGHSGGTIDAKSHGATSNGHFKIDLYVSKNGNVTGILVAEGTSTSHSKKSFGIFNYASTGAGYSADGSHADAIVFSGSMELEGHVNVTYPITFTTPINTVVPGAFGMHFKHVACGTADGDLAEEGRAAQQSAGFSTNVTAPFILT